MRLASSPNRFLALSAALISGLCSHSSTAQPAADWTALQGQADAAVAQAQSELLNTKATILLSRDDAQSAWQISIDGLIAGTQVEYSGTVLSIDDSSGTPALVASPPTPTSDASADLSESILRAAAAALVDVDDQVTELSFTIDAPLAATSDPVRFEGIDVTTLSKHTITQTTTTSPEFRLIAGSQRLSTPDSYFKIASEYGLSKSDVQDLFSGKLDEIEVVEAFRRGAKAILGEHGISAASASQVYDLRRSLGDSPAYYQQAFALLGNAGEPVGSLIAKGTPIDDPDGPLARLGDPGDLEMELCGETEVEVSVPPFVKVKVKVGIKVKGKLSDYAAMQQALNAPLAKAADEAKKQAVAQLQNRKEAIDQLVDMFKTYLDGLELPSWIRWLLA